MDLIRDLLGLGRDIADVRPGEMAMRAVVIYAVTLAIVRFGSKRLLSRATAFDIIVAIMLGSVMSRGINGSAAFVSTIVAGATLVAIHWLLAFITSRFDWWFGPVVKGRAVLLIRDGKVQRDGMREARLSDNDLEEQLRLNGAVTDPSQVRLAYFERNGRISVIRADD